MHPIQMFVRTNSSPRVDSDKDRDSAGTKYKPKDSWQSQDQVTHLFSKM